MLNYNISSDIIVVFNHHLFRHDNFFLIINMLPIFVKYAKINVQI